MAVLKRSWGTTNKKRGHQLQKFQRGKRALWEVLGEGKEEWNDINTISKMKEKYTIDILQSRKPDKVYTYLYKG